MKNNEITVLKVEPGKAPETVTIPNTLEAAQKMVGGYIEVLNVDNACLVCNEDGKLTGLEGNRRLGNDIITGTFFLTGCTDDGDFCSLTPEQMEWLQLVKDHIAASLSIQKEDLELSPFDRRGGLGRFYQVFGDKYEEILREMNRELVA